MESLEEKVRNECQNNLMLAKRRFEFLKSMPKSMRPIDHKQVVEVWEKVIKEFC